MDLVPELSEVLTTGPLMSQGDAGVITLSGRVEEAHVIIRLAVGATHWSVFFSALPETCKSSCKGKGY